MKTRIALLFAFFSFAYGDVAFRRNISPPCPDPNQNSKKATYFADASFIYWFAKEDGLNIAHSALINSSGIEFLASNSEILKASFSYDPGFKLGFGYREEDWKLFAEYTWFMTNHTKTQGAPNISSTLGAGIWSMDSWFLHSVPISGRPIAATSVSATWNLELNVVDLLVDNPLYKSPNVKMFGFVGLRTAWIHQKFNISLTEAAASATLSSGASGILPPQPIHSRTSSHSWGIGPKVGLETKYFATQEFRFEGNLAASLLYTRFTDVNHSEDAIALLSLPGAITDKLGTYSSVRPVVEANLGFGWGREIYHGKYFIDLLATYDFSLFWGQNAMRQMMDEYWVGVQAAAGDLYLHGLTFTACFKF